MSRLLYTLAIVALLPWARLHLWLRSRKQPEYLDHIDERFGHYPVRKRAAPIIWIHAVSVGETRAAEPVIRALQGKYPGHQILLSHMTPTGRATQSATLDTCERCYLPYDTPWGVASFLAHYQPVIGLVMETELWPNLIAACAAKHIPLLLINARLSDKSARRYARFSALSRQALQGLAAIAAQNKSDAARLAQLGAKDVAIVGNVKFDLTIDPQQTVLAETWRHQIGDRKIFLLASTREGEESLLLDAWKIKLAQTNTAHPLLVLVPRHPQRFAEVTQLAQQAGFNVTRRSEGLPTPETDVWVGDSMGEMGTYYGLADVAFIGGSLLDFGSQNLIEACAAGTPVVLGQSTYNFAQAAHDALMCGAATQITDAESCVATAIALLDSAEKCEQMHLAALAFATAHRGATERTMAIIGKYLD